MNVWISIRGIQQVGEDSETLELNTIGWMEHTDEGYRVTYEESETTGMAGVTTSMLVQPHSVTMQRQGAMNSVLILEKDQRTLCNYDTGYGILSMGVYTSNMIVDLNEHGGEFYFHYTLNINNEYTSSHDVHVTVREVDSPDKDERR